MKPLKKESDAIYWISARNSFEALYLATTPSASFLAAATSCLASTTDLATSSTALWAAADFSFSIASRAWRDE